MSADHGREQLSRIPGTPLWRARVAQLAAFVVVLVALAAVLGMKVLYRTSVHAPSPSVAGAGELRVSRDFGSRPMLQRRVALSATSTVLGLLSGNAKVGTSYGGGFVSSIDGVASTYAGAGTPQTDWFYYVNGMQAQVGAADYRLRSRDRVWWDFHRWGFAASVPAVVGQYPEPFLSGVGDSARPTAVVCAPGAERSGAAVADALRSATVTSVTVSSWPSDGVLPGSAHVVLVGTWAQLAGLTCVSDAAEHAGTSGLFVRFGRDTVTMLDALGQASRSLSGAGAIMATCRAEDPRTALWLVTGSELADVAAAADVLAKHAPELDGHFGVAVTRSGCVLAVPTEEAGQ